jgi:hypothetical protein
MLDEMLSEGLVEGRIRNGIRIRGMEIDDVRGQRLEIGVEPSFENRSARADVKFPHFVSPYIAGDLSCALCL